jgi:branched-chain amino acid transport system permease protein
MDSLILQALNGLASASSVFLVAVGLSIIFGVTRIANFAHGSLYMLGAYAGWTLAGQLMPAVGAFGFWASIVLTAALVGLLGAAIEMTLLRRLYGAPELFQLLATFGIVLIVQDAALWLWGPNDLLGPRAPGLTGAVDILGQRFPRYELFLIALGPVVLGLLWLLLHRTRWGMLVRAATQDREMLAALGINQAALFTSVFCLGAALAGLGGALQLPRESVNLHMDLTAVVDAFVVVVVGGMGSIPGAYVAALLVGELQALQLLVPDFAIAGVTIAVSKMTLVPSFVVMAVVLAVRPYGLFGRPLAEARSPASIASTIGPAPFALKLLGAVALFVLAVAPLLAGEYVLALLTEVAIFALFAASLHFMMGPGGLVSFGHAAYFGLGAYGAALAHKSTGGSMALGVAAAPLLATIGAVVFGALCVRLSGVYLAMLTLAVAQIWWAVASQWVEVTGGDNGLLGIWPEAWAASSARFYYLALVLCLAAILALRHLIYTPFGYALRAVRDSPLRAEVTGIGRFRVQWTAFVIAAAGAGLAGGLFAYSKGSVFPTYVAISKSVDALLMVLLGGIQSVSGPIVGAIVYVGLFEELTRWTSYWRAGLGALIVAAVLLFPQGIAGWAAERWARRGRLGLI